MNLAAMLTYLDGLVMDSKLSPDFTQMINDVIFEVAGDFELPALKVLTPWTLTVDDSKWLWQMPDEFHKKLFMVRSTAVTPWRYIRVCPRVEYLNEMNPAHDDTGEYVTDAAVAMQGENQYLGIYPLPTTAEILKLWGYRQPTRLVNAADVPDCMPAEYHERVILAKCVIKNFRFFTDAIEDGPMKSLAYWQGEYKKGLYGEAMGDIGLINYLAKARGGPRHHGGRDPIGPGRNYRGYY